MKNLILTLLGLIIIGFTFGQTTLSSGNGGQNPENGSVKIEYIGGGKVRVTNKQNGISDIKVVDNLHDTVLTIPALSFGIFTIRPGSTSIKAKALTNLGGTDFGWVELQISTPLHFTSFYTERISDSTFYLNFSIADVVNVRVINIKASIDGKVYRIIQPVKPDQTAYRVFLNLGAFVRQNTPRITK